MVCSVEVSSVGAGVASAGGDETVAAFGEVDSFEVSDILCVCLDNSEAIQKFERK